MPFNPVGGSGGGGGGGGAAGVVTAFASTNHAFTDSNYAASALAFAVGAHETWEFSGSFLIGGGSGLFTFDGPAGCAAKVVYSTNVADDVSASNGDDMMDSSACNAGKFHGTVTNGATAGTFSLQGKHVDGDPQLLAKSAITAIRTPIAGAQIAQSALNAKTDFGAAGDGSADDTIPLQAWLDAGRAQGRPCYLPYGTYKTTGKLVTFGDGLVIFGDGQGPSGAGLSLIAQHTAGEGGLYIFGGSANNLIIRDLSIAFAGTTGTSTAKGMYFQGFGTPQTPRTATLNSSTSVTSIDTTGLANAMEVVGVGIPDGTTISAHTGSTLTLSAAATLSGAATLYFESASGGGGISCAAVRNLTVYGFKTNADFSGFGTSTIDNLSVVEFSAEGCLIRNSPNGLAVINLTGSSHIAGTGPTPLNVVHLVGGTGIGFFGGELNCRALKQRALYIDSTQGVSFHSMHGECETDLIPVFQTAASTVFDQCRFDIFTGTWTQVLETDSQAIVIGSIGANGSSAQRIKVDATFGVDVCAYACDVQGDFYSGASLIGSCKLGPWRPEIQSSGATGDVTTLGKTFFHSYAGNDSALVIGTRRSNGSTYDLANLLQYYTDTLANGAAAFLGTTNTFTALQTVTHSGFGLLHSVGGVDMGLYNNGTSFIGFGTNTNTAFRLFTNGGHTNDITIDADGTLNLNTLALKGAGSINVGTTNGTTVTRIRMGQATLTLGTVVVSDANVTANTKIFLALHTLGTIALAAAYEVTARTASTSFTITSSQATDTSVIDWLMIEP